MRKRIIDPEFWSDEGIGSWSFATRLFYIGLWNFADDEGRFKAHNDLLKSQIFPYDKKINIDKLKKELGEKVHWYAIENSNYGFIRNFSKYQRIDRPTGSKLPPPPGQIGEVSSSNRGDVPPNISKDNISKVNISKENIQSLWIRTFGRNPKYLEIQATERIIEKFGNDQIYIIMRKGVEENFNSIFTLEKSLDEQGNIKPKDSNNGTHKRGNQQTESSTGAEAIRDRFSPEQLAKSKYHKGGS